MRSRFSNTALAAAVLVIAAAVAHAMGMGMGPRHGGGMGGPGGMMGPPPSLGENPLPPAEDVLARGRTLFDANCAVCHGPQGRGDGPAASGLNPRPPDLQGAASAWSDGQIAAQVRNGRGAMPPFRDALDDEAIWAVVHYLRRLQR